MYAQIATIRVPLGAMGRMRAIIQDDYLSQIRLRPGFVSALFLEQLDDPDGAELIVLWENQAAVERFNNTGMLEATVHALSANLPGAQVQREGYTLTIAMGVTPDALGAAVAVP